MITINGGAKLSFLVFLRDKVPATARVLLYKELQIKAGSELFKAWEDFDNKCG